MDKLIMMGLFALSALLVMTGIFINAKSTLIKQGESRKIFNKFWAVIIKYSGLSILAYLVYICPSHKIIFYLCIFIATYFVSFLLYLLARKASLR